MFSTGADCVVITYHARTRGLNVALPWGSNQTQHKVTGLHPQFLQECITSTFEMHQILPSIWVLRCLHGDDWRQWKAALERGPGWTDEITNLISFSVLFSFPPCPSLSHPPTFLLHTKKKSVWHRQTESSQTFLSLFFLLKDSHGPVVERSSSNPKIDRVIHILALCQKHPWAELSTLQCSWYAHQCALSYRTKWNKKKSLTVLSAYIHGNKMGIAWLS